MAGIVLCEGIHLKSDRFWGVECDVDHDTISDHVAAVLVLSGACGHEHVTSYPLCPGCAGHALKVNWMCYECARAETGETSLGGHAHSCHVYVRQVDRVNQYAGDLTLYGFD